MITMQKGETKMKNNFKSKIQLSKLKTKFKKKRKTHYEIFSL